jgi:hypothetical protein
MNASNVELTQGVSQMTGPTVISIADDLLQTPRMTIEDLIEATEVSIDSIMFLCMLSISHGHNLNKFLLVGILLIFFYVFFQKQTQKCHGSVLAWTCEFATDAGWFYQACTKCSSRISFLGGQLYCEKCRLPRTAIPKYGVFNNHFILFLSI